VPSGIALTSSRLGGATRAIIRAVIGAPGSVRRAPASVKASSRILAPLPAPRSTVTSIPSPDSFPTVSGVAATRRSPAAVSRGTSNSTTSAPPLEPSRPDDVGP
jgi:hypothetical protein